MVESLSPTVAPCEEGEGERSEGESDSGSLWGGGEE